jgi:hypothetical protein
MKTAAVSISRRRNRSSPTLMCTIPGLLPLLMSSCTLQQSAESFLMQISIKNEIYLE